MAGSMFMLGPFAFSQPWALLGLISLPIIFFVVRALPPAPKRMLFAPARIILGLKSPEETPARTPLLIILLRMAAAALICLGLADPRRAAAPNAGGGDLLLVIDDGWTSAINWNAIKTEATAAIEEAERSGGVVRFLFTAPEAAAQSVMEGVPPDQARSMIQARTPKSWMTDSEDAARRVEQAKQSGKLRAKRIVWINDGLQDGGEQALARQLGSFGPIDVRRPLRLPHALKDARIGSDGVELSVTRAKQSGGEKVSLMAVDRSGLPLGSTEVRFAAGAENAKAQIALPPALSARIGRVRIDGESSAGATFMFDGATDRPLVGLAESDASQPLLSDFFYLERALSPYAELRRGDPASLAREGVSVVILADAGQLAGPDHNTLKTFVERGGLLVRFAGPRLAAQSDDLTPTPLRGMRALNSAMGWGAQGITEFDADSPFSGLSIPPEVHINSVALAQPEPDLADKTWARLADGAPLVTAAARGKGLIVLFHVTAGPGWSDLPLTGLYVDMLRRTIALAGAPSEGASLAGGGYYEPERVMDGFGALKSPGGEVRPIAAKDWLTAKPGPGHPAGLYRRAGIAAALNAGSRTQLNMLGALPNSSVAPFGRRSSISYSGQFLASALMLLLIDALIALAALGRWTPGTTFKPKSKKPGKTGRRRVLQKAGGLIAVSLLGLATPHPAKAQDADPSALRLAYVRTGDSRGDSLAQAALAGLTRQLTWRTSIEPTTPTGVNLETDELAFYPILFWWPPRDATNLSPTAAERLQKYLRNGGCLVIDTRDADRAYGDSGQRPLAALLAGVDAPPLQVTPKDHVLTRSFFLLKTFPGRYSNGKVWVEAPTTNGRAAAFDGVSSLIIGSNDWASAWAINGAGKPVAPVEGGERQREFAFRAGINMVMYALTGNYKADQVHVPALLDRLGETGE
ncbi:MAG: DUF4159 domain-containing protein [Caulobacterales bacterium]